MNREAKSQSALLALARTRRVNRALAHAYLHRDQPMPTLHQSLGFVTSTTCTSDDEPMDGAGHHMTLAGSADGVAYVIEELETGDAPVFYRLFLRGARQGHLVPCAGLPRRLAPCARTTTEAWMLSTRVVQRRALRLPLREDGTQPQPIRKYALQLRVEPVSGLGASGSTTVTAFLRPEARLADVWIAAGEPATAIARVTYTGVPSGLGQPKDTVVLLTE